MAHGWLATANRTSQPNTPNTDVLNIPQDPGHANAYELGVGVSRSSGPALFGMDVVYQPIWSTTWAEASTPTATLAGGLIPVAAGRSRTASTFRTRCFAWASVTKSCGRSRGPRPAAGARGALRPLQPGAAGLRRGGYNQLKESWAEWTPTWGLTLRHPEFELCYRGACRTGRIGWS